MPPKKSCRKSKKKTKSAIKKTSTAPNPPQDQNFLNISYPYSSPSISIDDSDEFIIDLDNYEDSDEDFTNPINHSLHNFIQDDEYMKKKPSFIFPKVDNLDVYRGKKKRQALMKLPVHIFMNIISRLSIKPLAICRCVCKTWGSLIHHPSFIMMHYERVTKEFERKNCVLFYVSKTVLEEFEYEETGQVFSEMFLLEYEKDNCIENGVLVNPQFMPSKRVYELGCDDFKFEVVGSCNGLLCLAEPMWYDPIYVCNPVIGEYMILPATNKSMDCEIVSGIGFDQTANEYKVVKAVFSSRQMMEAEVYTLGSDKWRKIGSYSYPRFKTSAVFVEGGLHWIAADFQDPYELIFCFDMENEGFDIVSTPRSFRETSLDSDSYELHLGELGGRLCLFDYSFENRCEVWLMKKYGVGDSWRKDYIISRNVFGSRKVYFKPLKLMVNGNILLVVDNQYVACYETKKKRFRKLEVRLPPRFDAIVHAGTFISLRDFIEPANRNHCATTGEWYGTMKSITSHNPDIDVEGWKLNEKLRRLWRETHKH
ncbi:hypothetical protein ACHQM5_005326 [Ranunculus cassubicifolius]